MKYFSINFQPQSSIADIVLINKKSIAVLTFSLIAYVGSTAIWIYVLRDFPLSRAYIFMSLGFVLVPCMAYFLFGEQLNVYFVIGTALVIAGVYISTL